MKDYCYRFVKDGRHLHPNRLVHFGSAKEVVEEIPALKGWAVRVPRKMDRERFEKHFTCGRYAPSRVADNFSKAATAEAMITSMHSRLTNIEQITQRGFVPIPSIVPTTEVTPSVSPIPPSTIPKNPSLREGEETGGRTLTPTEMDALGQAHERVIQKLEDG